MAKNYDDIGGVWRTIGGRRVFIKDGQSLSEAMIASGKFKNLRSDYRKAKEEEKKKEIDPDLLDKQALELYEKRDDAGWEKFSDEELKELARQCQITKDNPFGRAYDDEVFEEMDKRGLKLEQEKVKVGEWSINEQGKKEYNERELGDNERGYWTKENGQRVFKENPNYKEKTYDGEYERISNDIKGLDRRDAVEIVNKELDNGNITQAEARKLQNEIDKDEKVNDRKFKASMGEVDIPDNFKAQFNDYAKGQEEKERLDIAKDIAKEVYGLKNASPERIEKEARGILEYSDGEVLEKGDQPYTNSKGELERSTKSLKEWRDELKKTSENKDGFTQQTDMYGGTYEYTQQRLNEMKEHGTKPLEHSYTGGGWQGLKYDSTLSTKDIAKNINDYSKKEFPDVKLSRKTDYNGIDMYVMSSDKDMFVSEKDIDNMNFSDLEQVTRSNGFNWWAKENVKDYNTNHSYSIDDVRKYAKEQLNTTKSHDSNPSSDSWYLSDYGKKVISGLNKEMNSYNYDDSDGMVDYFNTNFYGYVHIGKWDKPYQVNQKASASDINGAIRQKAYQKYLKEHPASKITFEQFKDMRK